MIYHIMEEIGISHDPRNNLNEITRIIKLDRATRKLDILLNLGFHAEKPITLCACGL